MAHAMQSATQATHHHSRSCCVQAQAGLQPRPVRCRASVNEVAQLVPQITDLSDVHTAAASLAELATQPAQMQLQAGPSTTAGYTPGPVEVGWQIWFAAIVSTIPFVVGAWEFGKRIVIQRRCKVCGGSGLVTKGRFQRKCPECGGFFPWISWSMFLSANARPGNGGPLLQPRGQTSVLYTVPPADSQQPQQPQQQGVHPTADPTSGSPETAAQKQQPTTAVQQPQQRQES